jgi:hypothetical protein
MTRAVEGLLYVQPLERRSPRTDSWTNHHQLISFGHGGHAGSWMTGFYEKFLRGLVWLCSLRSTAMLVHVPGDI